MRSVEQRLALALDVASLDAARGLISSVAAYAGVMKVGLQLFIAEGPAAVRAVTDSGSACFLDLKLHDIPATVGRATRAAADLGVRYLTVHASGGPRALEAAREAVEGTDTELLAVTALTSHGPDELASIGWRPDGEAVVRRLAALAAGAGIGGFVCSPREAAVIRELVPEATVVTPGVRPAGSASDDQRRVMTPGEAVRAGADVLVVGRPIRDAADPAAAARAILAEIAAAS